MPGITEENKSNNTLKVLAGIGLLITSAVLFGVASVVMLPPVAITLFVIATIALVGSIVCFSISGPGPTSPAPSSVAVFRGAAVPVPVHGHAKVKVVVPVPSPRPAVVVNKGSVFQGSAKPEHAPAPALVPSNRHNAQHGSKGHFGGSSTPSRHP